MIVLVVMLALLIGALVDLLVRPYESWRSYLVSGAFGLTALIIVGLVLVGRL